MDKSMTTVLFMYTEELDVDHSKILPTVKRSTLKYINLTGIFSQKNKNKENLCIQSIHAAPLFLIGVLH